MDVINLTEKQFKRLKKLKLEPEISNDEADIYILNQGNWHYNNGKYLYKKLYKTDQEYFANKLLTVSMLKENIGDIGIEELVIPECFASVDGDINGIIIPRVRNTVNLGILLNNPKIDMKEKIKYLKMVGNLIEKTHKQEVIDFVFGDLHPYNFLVNRKKEYLYAIDLDSTYLNTNYPGGAHYLFENNVIGEFSNKYQVNVYGITTPNYNTDILCYTFMVLNTIANIRFMSDNDISKLSIENYFMYTSYLEELDYSKEFIDAIRSVYSNKDNINPYYFMDGINLNKIGMSSYKVYLHNKKFSR